MRKFTSITLAVVFLTITPTNALAEEGTAEQIGERIDRGLEQIGEKLQKTWAEVRKSVDQLSVQGRVYGRIRWDKELAGQPIDIAVKDRDVVVLTGSVSSEAQRKKAVQLAGDTIGVREVVDELQVKPELEIIDPSGTE